MDLRRRLRAVRLVRSDVISDMGLVDEFRPVLEGIVERIGEGSAVPPRHAIQFTRKVTTHDPHEVVRVDRAVQVAREGLGHEVYVPFEG